MHILVKTRRGKTVSLKVEGSDTFDIVNAKIRGMKRIRLEDSSNLRYIYNLNDDLDPTLPPHGSFKLFVRAHTKTGKTSTFTLYVEKDDTISDLKQKIFEQEDLFLFSQTLFFTGIKLDKEKSTIADYNICEESTIDLFIDHAGDLKLLIKTLSGKKISLDVFCSHTISQVKALIQEKEGVSPEQQRLVYAGQQLDGCLTLADYCIQKTSTTLLLVDDDYDTLIERERMLTIHVKIVATGKKFDLRVKSSDTVDKVKAKIQDVEDIPAHRQTLFFPQQQFQDGLTLNQCYILNNSTLRFVQTFG